MTITKNLFKPTAFIFLFLLFPFMGIAQERPAEWATPVKSLSLNNLYKIDEGVYRSEQPDMPNFKELEESGIQEVLNLRQYHSDEKKAENTGIILHRVQMNAHHIKDTDVVNALRIIKNRKGSILIHCKHGSDRTGVIVAMYRIIFQDWSKDKAIDEMRNGGYGFHRIYHNIPRYIREADVEKLKYAINN